MLFANVITHERIDAIVVINNGVRPADETLNDNTFFVYGDEDSDMVPEIITRSDFKRDYLWLDRTYNDNAVVKK